MIQGFEDYSTEQIEGIVLEHISGIFNDSGIDVEIMDVEIYGSRTRGEAKADSDLGFLREDRLPHIPPVAWHHLSYNGEESYHSGQPYLSGNL